MRLKPEIIFVLLSLSAFQASGSEWPVFESALPCGLSATQPNNLIDITATLKAAAVEDVKKFCDMTAWQVLPYVDMEHFSAADSIETFKANAAKIDVSQIGNPWKLSMVPDVRFRQAVLTDQEELLKRSLSEQASTSNIPISPNESVQSFLAMPEDGEAAGSRWVVESAALRTKLCADVTFTNAVSCERGLKNNYEYAKPKVGPGDVGNITAVPSFVKIFTDSKYVEGARKAALKIISRFDSGNVGAANLFSDIESSYIESGMNKKEASDATWEILATISSSGPNIAKRLDAFKASSPAFEQLKAALKAIAWATPKLDLISTQQGHPYSMPANVKSSCENGKPYHFWMTAYLARKGVQEGLSPMGSAAAAFIVQKAYEMKSSQGGRDPARAFIVDSYASYNNMMRIDVGISSAGAVFGANSAIGSTREINVDEGIRTIVKGGELQPRLSRQDAEKKWNEYAGTSGFNRWQKIIAADSGFIYQSKFLGK